MNTSLLYHAFGIAGYIYQGTRYIAGAVIVAISDDRWKLRCPVCRNCEVTCRGKKDSLWLQGYRVLQTQNYGIA